MVDPQTLKFLELLSSPFYGTLFFCFMIWSFVWKGFALWKSAHNNQRNWFIIILILNSFGILEIIYIFYFQANKGNKNETNIKI